MCVCMCMQDDQLASVKVEMGKVRQENERLKAYLNKMTMDYQVLKKKFHFITHEQVDQAPQKFKGQEMEPEEPEFVGLSLGRSSPGEVKGDADYKEKNRSPKKVEAAMVIDLKDKENGMVKLGLNCKFDEGPFPKPNSSMENSNPEEVVGEKASLKTMRSTVDDEVPVQQNPAKKARVSVRIRSEAPTVSTIHKYRNTTYPKIVSKNCSRMR